MAAENLPTFATTLEVRDACLCMHAQRAARALARRYDDALRPAGLTNGQFSVLMALNRPGRATMRDLAELLVMDRTTVTALLKPLARRGLVQIVTNEDDRRARGIGLTDQGRAVLQSALPAWRKTQREIEGLLEEPERLRADLRAVS